MPYLKALRLGSGQTRQTSLPSPTKTTNWMTSPDEKFPPILREAR